MNRYLPAAVIAFIAFALSASAMTLQEKTDTFLKAQQAFKEGNSLRTENSKLAKQKYALAAQLFERVEREGGIRNGKLYYNIGNSYFLEGRIGPAILNYRKAERLTPRHTDLRRNLRAARMLRKDQIETPSRKKALETLFFWHYDLSHFARFVMFMISFGTLWSVCIVSLLCPKLNLRWPIAAVAIISAALAASVMTEEHGRLTTLEGVVLSEEVIARKGDSESYSPSFNTPLHEGTEFVLISERGDWLHIRLMDGRTCWIPRSAVGLI